MKSIKSILKGPVAKRDFIYRDKVWGRQLSETEAIEQMPEPDPVEGWIPLSKWMLTCEDIKHFVDENEFKTFCAKNHLNAPIILTVPTFIEETLAYCMGCSKLCLNTRKALVNHCNEPEHLKFLSETHPDQGSWPSKVLGPSNRVPVSYEHELKAKKRLARIKPKQEEPWIVKVPNLDPDSSFTTDRPQVEESGDVSMVTAADVSMMSSGQGAEEADMMDVEFLPQRL